MALVVVVLLLANLSDTAALVVVVTAAVAAGGTWVKWIRPRVHATSRDLRAVRDTLIGRDEQRDSITGEVLTEALPGIGARMAHTEQSVASLAASVTELVDLRGEIGELRGRVTRIEDAVGIERTIGKLEHVQLLRTMEAAITADPHDPDDPPSV